MAAATDWPMPCRAGRAEPTGRRIRIGASSRPMLPSPRSSSSSSCAHRRRAGVGGVGRRGDGLGRARGPTRGRVDEELGRRAHPLSSRPTTPSRRASRSSSSPRAVRRRGRREFETALSHAKEDLDQAFALKQQLDDRTPDTEADTRAWNAQIIDLALTRTASSTRRRRRSTNFASSNRTRPKHSPASEQNTTRSPHARRPQRPLAALQRAYARGPRDDRRQPRAGRRAPRVRR
jgi:hypothetical protein